MDDWVEIAVAAIISDLTDRKGLGDAFDSIDEDIREEISSTWADIIRRAASAGQPSP